tara:strand:- start:285 stop:629 length:345 start_codon:yes stop_codon:yes gene_type:complete
MDWTSNMIKLIEKWNMNNGIDGFIDFHANHHPACRFTAEELEEIFSMSNEFLEIFMANEAHRRPPPHQFNRGDRWLGEQYQRWFTGTDRFATVAMYHRPSVDNTNLFYNWLMSK